MRRLLTDAEKNLLRERIIKSLTAKVDKELEKISIIKLGDKVTILFNNKIEIDTYLLFGFED